MLEYVWIMGCFKLKLRQTVECHCTFAMNLLEKNREAGGKQHKKMLWKNQKAAGSSCNDFQHVAFVQKMYKLKCHSSLIAAFDPPWVFSHFIAPNRSKMEKFVEQMTISTNKIYERFSIIAMQTLKYQRNIVLKNKFWGKKCNSQSGIALALLRSRLACKVVLKLPQKDSFLLQVLRGSL